MSDAGVIDDGTAGKAPFALSHPRLWFWLKAIAAFAAITTAVSVVVTTIPMWPIIRLLEVSVLEHAQDHFQFYWLPYEAVIAGIPTAIAARFAAEAFAEAWWKIAAAIGLLYIIRQIPTLTVTWNAGAVTQPTSVFESFIFLLAWPTVFTLAGLSVGAWWAGRREGQIGGTSKIARLRALREAGIRPVEGLHLVRGFVYWSVYLVAVSVVIRVLVISPIVVTGWPYFLITLSFALALGAFIAWRERIDPIKLLITTAVMGVGLALWQAANRAFDVHEAIRREIARNLQEGGNPSAQIQLQGHLGGFDVFDSKIWLPALMVLLGGAVVLFIKSPTFQRALAWSKRPPHFMRDD